MSDPKLDIYFLVFASIVLFSSFILFIVIFFNYYRKKQRKNIIEKEELKTKFNEEILRAQLEIQEQTLINISQEIHDNIGQVLSLAKLNLATTDLNKPEALYQKIDDSKNLVAKAIQDLRDLSKSLNTDYVIEMGLARSIEYELEMIKKSGVFQTNFEIEGQVYKIEPQKELILFRIVQEVLNNIIKHSKATNIIAKQDYKPGLFSMQIIDNGDGFDLKALKENSKFGLGIKNMHNRAKLIGADFQINSIIGKGTTASLSLPVISNAYEHAK